MKVQCVEQEITSFLKILKIEHEGKTYNAELQYDERSGYELRFFDENGEFMEMPEWADLFDNGQRSLDYTLDNASGMWEFCPAIPNEAEVVGYER
jgi:hypothetical protein